MKITEDHLRKIIRDSLTESPIMDRDPIDDSGRGAQVGAVTHQDWVGLNQRNDWCTAFSGGSDCASPVRQLVSLIDPTGVLAWPDLVGAARDYEDDPSDINGLILVLSAIAVIPVVGAPARVFSRLGTHGPLLTSALAKMFATGITRIPTRFQGPLRALWTASRRTSQGQTAQSAST